jgi:hypothetical protein
MRTRPRVDPRLVAPSVFVQDRVIAMLRLSWPGSALDRCCSRNVSANKGTNANDIIGGCLLIGRNRNVLDQDVNFRGRYDRS